jgi:hypothetical protein
MFEPEKENSGYVRVVHVRAARWSRRVYAPMIWRGCKVFELHAEDGLFEEWVLCSSGGEWRYVDTKDEERSGK